MLPVLSRVTIRPVGAFLALLVALSGLLLISATPLHINRLVPFAALLGPRNALTALACAGFVSASAAAAWRHGRPLTAPLALSLLLLTVISGTAVVGRGFTNPAPAAPAAGQLRILSWNTNGDLVAPSAIAALAARLRADVVVLPDANIGSTASSYAQALRDVRYPMWLDAIPGPSQRIAVYVTAPYAAHYHHVTAGPDQGRSLQITPDTPDLPAIVALHATQPTFHGTEQWNTDVNWVSDRCRSSHVIAVGDFNASVDGFGGSALGHCVDVASARGAGSVGTWPAGAPVWLGMPIDHILTAPGWIARTFTVITDEDHSGARHRPVFAVLARRAQGGVTTGFRRLSNTPDEPAAGQLPSAMGQFATTPSLVGDGSGKAQVKAARSGWPGWPPHRPPSAASRPVQR